MKTTIFTLIACLALSVSSFAQQPRPGKEKMQSLKIAFITDKLSLTPEEAKVFWPVYNKFQDEMQELRKKMRAANLETMDLTTLTDAEADKMISEMLAFKQAEVDLIKKYNVEFKKVLPVKKVMLLYKAEQEFKRKVMETWKDRQKK